MSHPRRLRRPLSRTVTAASVLLLTVPAISILATAPAQAAVTNPADGSTVSGNVGITESRGASNNCALGQDKGSARLTVTRLADSAQVHSASKSSSGSYSTTWNSIGQPRGDYQILSYAKDSKKSGFGNLGCSTASEAQLSSTTFHLDNQAAVAIDVPTTVTTGETLAVTVHTSIQAVGDNGEALGARTVTVDVPGVGSSEVVTDASGTATTNFDLPDLPVGALAVSAQVADDALYSGLSSTASTTLTARSTQVLYQGDTRAQQGRTAVLDAVVVDATPNSDRFGDPVVDVPLALAFGDDTEAVPTTASGHAVRTVAVDGSSRVVPVSASFAGDDVWTGSSDSVSFYVGDVTAESAPVTSGVVGSLTGALGGLLGGVVSSITSALSINVATFSSITGPIGMTNLLTTLLDPITSPLLDGISHSGDPVDDALDTIFDQVIAATPLGTITDAARFKWRSVYVTPTGTSKKQEFKAVVGVPQPLDVTGDGKADVVATVTLASVSADSVVPRLKIARVDNASQALPLSLQALIALPGSDQVYRFGYDTRTGQAPRSFTADIILAGGGATLQVTSGGQNPLTVSGAMVPADNTGPSAPTEQRFGVTFSQAPESASLGLALGGSGQDVAATLTTDRPTQVELSLADDSGGDQLFLANGVIDSVDGDFKVAVSGDDADGLGASVTSATGLRNLSLHAQSLDAGRTVDDVLLNLTDVPTSVSFGLSAGGAGELSASGPIGVFEAGYASGRGIAQLDDPAYLRLLQRDDTQSIALRLPGFEGMSIDTGAAMSLGLTMAPTPLRALIDQDGQTFDAQITDAPHQLNLGLADDGSLSVQGSDPICQVTVTGHDAEGIFSGATDLDLQIDDIPNLLSVGATDGGVRFDTGGQPIGQVRIFADNGTHLAVPGGGDGLLVNQSPGATSIAGQITGLRTIEADLSSAPEVLLDTTAGQVFTINLTEVDEAGTTTNTVNAVLDHLVPNMRLGLVDDGTGATKLTYSADEATNSLSFDMGGLSGSIAGPLPAQLTVCMAGDEACLPALGFVNPDLGSIRFLASEPTTLNLVDPEGGINVSNLRMQALDLTGSMDIDNGGDVYLNTTEYGGDCGDAGCVRPIESGKIVADMGSAGLTFEPGNGFYASDAITHLKVTKLLGQPVGLEGTGGTGVVHCVSATKLNVTAYDVLGIGDVTLSVKDALCNVNRS